MTISIMLDEHHNYLLLVNSGTAKSGWDTAGKLSRPG
jgi:hypothetical protein